MDMRPLAHTTVLKPYALRDQYFGVECRVVAKFAGNLVVNLWGATTHYTSLGSFAMVCDL